MDNQYSSIKFNAKTEKISTLIIYNQHAKCEISLFGAHVLSYINCKDGRERLWLSEKAIFDGVTPIRGGIPICWPWFSSHPTKLDFPSHGYARTQMWQVREIQEQTDEEDKVIQTCVILRPENACLQGYKALSVYLKVTVGTTLKVELVTTNNAAQPVQISQALHTYFKVDDISKVKVNNIHEPYFDKPTQKNNLAVPAPYDIQQEVDRIHVLPSRGVKQVTISHINKNEDSQRISMTGADSVVVWNPWQEKSDAMKDMHQDAFKTMLCIEAANTVKANEPLQIAANSQYTIAQEIY